MSNVRYYTETFHVLHLFSVIILSLSHHVFLYIYPLCKLRQPIRSVNCLTSVFNHCMLITVQSHCGSEWLPPCIPACAIYCFLQLYVAAPFVHNSTLKQPPPKHSLHHGGREGMHTTIPRCPRTRRSDSLSTSVYRKPTHTERYIPFSSHHHPKTITGVLRCMKDRAHSICDAESRKPELHHLKDVFLANGFLARLVKKTLSTLSQAPHSPPLPIQPPQNTLCTPYVRGVSEKLKRICAPLNIRMVFTPAYTLKRTLMKVKNCVPEEKKKAVVYHVPCKDCCKLYTGESKRTLKVRLAEHKRAVQKSDVNNGIAMHVANTNHSIDWVNARVVKTVPGYWERRITEAILIKKSQKPMNLDNGLLLPSVWNPVLLNPPPPTHPPHDDVT